MGSKSYLLFALLVLVFITSQVLAQTSDGHTEVNDVGAGGGGYPGGGGGYCHFGCCGRRDYRGYCLRCCGVASEGVDAQVKTEVNDFKAGGGDVGAGGGGGGYPPGGGGGGGGGPGGSYCHFGCCGRRTPSGYCLRCCGVASEGVDAQEVETKLPPHN